jgi:hypothetical protein|tara:strand:+ start:165 stop:347 length:183 start_codon:yes stop_codon:yes gene_type:complete
LHTGSNLRKFRRGRERKKYIQGLENNYAQVIQATLSYQKNYNPSYNSLFLEEAKDESDQL